MHLGLKRDEVRLVDYTPAWKDEFIRIKNDLLQLAELEEKRIEHIGSTASEGISAKPFWILQQE